MKNAIQFERQTRTAPARNFNGGHTIGPIEPMERPRGGWLAALLGWRNP